MIEATVNYLAPMPERPFFYLCEPPAGSPWRNTRGDRRTVSVEDARDLDLSLDREGFMLARHVTSVGNLHDPNAIVADYYREMEALVREVTGAARVVAFDHNLRSSAATERADDLSQAPVRFAHNDYTERSAPQRVRDLLHDEAEELLRHRFTVVNAWKPIRGPVKEAPLAVCSAPTLRAEELVETDLRYRERTGEIYSLRFSPAHRWFYFPELRTGEVMLLKCFDSARDRARFTAHTAIDDPTSSPDAPPRESIEVRTLAFFG